MGAKRGGIDVWHDERGSTMNERISYSEILKNYWNEYSRMMDSRKMVALLLIATITAEIVFAGEADGFGIMVAIPILFSLISGAFHTVSLPQMMYLLPLTNEMREEYIQKSLYVKVGVPLSVAVVVDAILLFLEPSRYFALLLQMLTVFLVSYIMGMINEGSGLWNEGKAMWYDGNPAYGGGFRYFADLCLIFCYWCVGILGLVCGSKEIKLWEFFTVLGFELLIYGSIAIIVARRWKRIRANFANYERAFQKEAAGAR